MKLTSEWAIKCGKQSSNRCYKHLFIYLCVCVSEMGSHCAVRLASSSLPDSWTAGLGTLLCSATNSLFTHHFTPAALNVFFLHLFKTPQHACLYSTQGHKGTLGSKSKSREQNQVANAGEGVETGTLDTAGVPVNQNHPHGIQGGGSAKDHVRNHSVYPEELKSPHHSDTCTPGLQQRTSQQPKYGTSPGALQQMSG